MSDTSDQELSHYRLLEKIGEGGMGVVWKAKDKVLGRTVAIKVLPPDISRDEGRRRMFLREAQLASSISHAHIVQVYEFARDKDLDFIVMEYVEGVPLSRHLQGRPLPADKVAQIGLQATQALSRAHRSSLLHRDLKPANLLITEHGDVKIVDFGLAALFSTDATEVGAGDVTHTAIGIPVSSPGQPSLSGTIPYMSPEQARGDELDPRSDIFSMGSVLYEMTTGQRPFNGATSAELLQELLQGVFVPPHKIVPKLPLELDRIIRKALSPRRAERYQTMDDLAVDLKRFGRDWARHDKVW